jgi:hypothetical protein
MKIFYKSIPNPTEIIDKNQFSHEELMFPQNIFEQLKESLEESALLLPSSARQFQEWNVGLLERFGEKDLMEEDVMVAPTPPTKDLNGKLEEERGQDVAIESIPNSSALLD